MGLVFWIWLGAVEAQSPYSNKKSQVIFVDDSFIWLTADFVIPQSIEIKSLTHPQRQYSFVYDQKTHKIVFPYSVHDTLLVYWRILPLEIPKTTHRLNPVDTNTTMRNNSEQNDILDLGGLVYKGSIVRGMTLGNNISTSLQSGMNFSLGGKLANGTEVSANISDQNIPIQADGNSYSLQEFDRIFIQIKKKPHTLNVGDFDIAQIKNSRYLHFDRKLQGFQYQYQDTTKENSLTFGGSIAITRGVFARNVLPVVENNQGPYRLLGNNAEVFLIIISGTERVYLNGVLLKRGENNDYIIDYNIGQITFTNKRMITHDMRLVVEFQYTDVSFEKKNWSTYHQVFFESDVKTQPLNTKLDSSAISLLSQIGNQTDLALIQNYNKTTWDETRVLYRRIDTTVLGRTYRDILRLATSKTDSAYSAVFTFVGENQGDYSIASSSANGVVYQFIAPINGIKQGAYAPISLIPAPKSSLQAISGLAFRPNDKTKIAQELSYTSIDPNTFSALDNEKNHGFAAYHTLDLALSKAITINLSNDFSSKQFEAIQRFRSLEFSRDWNLPFFNRNEHHMNITKAKISYQKEKFRIENTSQALIYGRYRGLENFVGGQWEISKKWRYNFDLRTLLAENSVQKIQFYRPIQRLRYAIDTNKSLEISHKIEFNKRYNDTGTLPESFYWQDIKISQSSKYKSFQYDISYGLRLEKYGIYVDKDKHSMAAHQIEANLKYSGLKKNQFTANLSYRNLQTDDKVRYGSELNHNYLGQITHQGQILKGLMTMNSKYELKAGREQATQLSYVRAVNGIGTYAWNDLNGNGIFELDEAYVSQFALENKYIKFYTTLLEFVPVNQVNFKGNYTFTPRALLYNSNNRLGKWLNNIEYSLLVDFQRKTIASIDKTFGEFVAPVGKLEQEDLMESRVYLQHQIHVLKNNPNTSLNLYHNYLDYKNLLTNGLEGNALKSYGITLRNSINRQFKTTTEVVHQLRNQSSEFFNERNFSMVDNSISEQIQCQIKNNLIANINIKYNFKSTSQQWVPIWDVGSGLKWTIKKLLIDAQLKWIKADYQYNIQNPQVELSMLNGLDRGENIVAQMNINQSLGKLLSLNLIYQGRYNQINKRYIQSMNLEFGASF